eukprot:6472400-Pyramimonas_sp.AAC.1
MASHAPRPTRSCKYCDPDAPRWLSDIFGGLASPPPRPRERMACRPPKLRFDGATYRADSHATWGSDAPIDNRCAMLQHGWPGARPACPPSAHPTLTLCPALSAATTLRARAILSARAVAATA